MAKILTKFGEQQLVMVNYACGFSQSETGMNNNVIYIKAWCARDDPLDIGCTRYAKSS